MALERRGRGALRGSSNNELSQESPSQRRVTAAARRAQRLASRGEPLADISNLRPVLGAAKSAPAPVDVSMRARSRPRPGHSLLRDLLRALQLLKQLHRPKLRLLLFWLIPVVLTLETRLLGEGV